MEAVLVPDVAVEAYDGLAPHYDAFTAGHDYDRWLGLLEGVALEHGLAGRALLDIGCGTGKSFLGMLARGYEVVACDLSPEMVARAREKVPDGRAEVFVADMRALPEVGAFDLITCLDDAVNYLRSRDELRAALEGFARNLRPGGIAIFDANTLGTYRVWYAGTTAIDSDGAFFCIRGEASPDLEPGDTASVWIEIFSPGPGDLWRRTRSRHVQRHHPRWEVEDAAAEAGLELVAVHGQTAGPVLTPDPDDEADTKFVYVVRKPTRELSANRG
jgi:SAM-dependent methyltransferase